jgi:hypothetical protein
VPTGAPDTGVEPTSAAGTSPGEIAGIVGGGVLVLGGAGAALKRRARVRG